MNGAEQMRLHVVTFGCQMSAAEGEELAAPLRAKGFSAATNPDDADAIVLNTCTVRQHAEDRALSLIGRLREWKAKDPERILIVAGCAAQRLGDHLTKRFPYIDLVVGAQSIEDYPSVIAQALGSRFNANVETAASFPQTPSTISDPTYWPSPFSSYLTIMRGCNYSCSYCIVPAVRGRERYRPFADILREAAVKISSGARELTLLGQTVNSYKSFHDGKEVQFSDLLRRVGAIEGLWRLRFESPHPYFFNENMMNAMSQTRSICEQLHAPLQSGSQRLLKLMRRNYTPDEFEAKINRLRAAIPRVEVSTDIIVGFPSETEDDFKETLALVERLRPSWSYTFKYSPRAGTESAEMPDDVPFEVKEDRLNRLNALCDRLTEDALKARYGSVVEVLDEEGGFGRTRDGFRVRWSARGDAGRLVNVRITGSSKRVLQGEIHEP